MITENYIDKNNGLTPAEDYSFLKQKGLKYIEQLSHHLWTDYNAHDPGITTLEILMYAITELGYRTEFSITDILTSPSGKIENNTFFTAKNILTNAPVTVLDYRKALIDIKGVNNAWVVTHTNNTDDNGYLTPIENEMPIHINKLEDKLFFRDKNKRDIAIPQLKLRGLNNVIVELSSDVLLDEDVLSGNNDKILKDLNEINKKLSSKNASVSFGNLNTIDLNFYWFDGFNFIEITIKTDFDTWNNEATKTLKLFNTPSKIKNLSVTTVNKEIIAKVERTSNPSQSLELTILVKEFDELSKAKSFLSNETIIAAIINSLYLKKQYVETIYKEIHTKLYENRNLAEDWKCIETINETEISICADIHLETNADAEETLAKIYQAIEAYLNPEIKFYTLSQMFEKGFKTREIFNGPSLKHGFLIDEEVEKNQLPHCIQASDIISKIMQIDGVKDFRNFSFTAYDQDNKPKEGSKNQSWNLNLDGISKPVFNANKSKLLPFRDGIPFLISEKGAYELQNGIHNLKLENNYYKLQNPISDIPIPEGKYFQLNEYTSIQTEFPQAYKIGKNQILKSAPNKRKAQAKQFKGYLQHFDQLLADFFNQLHHSKDLLDIKKLTKTYYSTYLSEIDGVDEHTFSDEIYSNDFQNILLNGEKTSDRSLFETETTFYKRRNKFLDHLMARFAESFNDYVFMMNTMQKNAKGLAELKIQNEDLIKDKQRFIENYPEISYKRGLGINYLQQPTENNIWNIAKRSGYEKRIGSILGLNNMELKDCVIYDDTPQSSFHFDTDIGKLNFKIFSVPSMTAQEKWNLTHQLIHDVSAYYVDGKKKNYIYFVASNGKKIAKFNQQFSTQEEATNFVSTLYQAINSTLENFYCIEHILLRPMFSLNGDLDIKNQHLMHVCLNDDCYSEASNDPYSFKITIVLRGDLARFRNIYFRRYAEKVMQMEAPAHVLVKVCWVSKSEMNDFQKIYQKWIIAYRKLKSKMCKKLLDSEKELYNNALLNIINQLKELNTIYQTGTLYNCQESELDNPIVLGSTFLGTL